MEIFGILNVTPDSFSDGGNFISLDKAKTQVQKIISEGATIIDVGGESTRPGAEFVDEQTEIERVVPVIAMIKANFDVEVSIDTYKSPVAKAAIEAGATIINDVKANRYDGKMLELVKMYNVKYVAMHSRKSEHPLADMKALFTEILAAANNLQIDLNLIILDPGIGFNKDTEQNLKIMNNLKSLKAQFQANQFLLGTSRKRFIGAVNHVEAADQRIIGTTVTTVVGFQAGFEYVRVHDVLANKQAIEMIAAIDKS
ncbi:dihydropteroate synthase [Mollicutes bacterium LVI A0039]|nr:dihydropteroate synthase [Mollicutes bacterium LVI A0039]